MQGKGSNNSKIDKITDYITDTLRGVNKLKDKTSQIAEIADFLLKNKDKRIFTCGNGGSSSAASHMVNDLVIFKGINIMCLSDNIPTLTAVANDDDYSEIFSTLIYQLGNEGDILIVFSGSGNSLNIINAIKAAINKKMKIIAIIGISGGKVVSEFKNDLDYLIHIPIPMGNYEDISVVFNHCLMEALKCAHSSP